MNFWEILASVGAVAAALIAGLALVGTVILTKRQMELTKTIHEQQTLLAQRQLLLPLWDHLIGLNDIDPNDPVWVDVIGVVNALELVAVCWEGQLIDENVIRRVFHQQYIDFYEKVVLCQNPPPSVRLNGREMMRASRAATRLYQRLLDEHVGHNELDPIQN